MRQTASKKGGKTQGVQYLYSVRHPDFMNNKLTLRMDESLIASAKDYAAAHGSSVSQMVANYFAALAQIETAQTAPIAASVSASSSVRLGGSLSFSPSSRRK